MCLVGTPFFGARRCGGAAGLGGDGHGRAEQSGSGERLDQGFGRRRRMDARELHCRQRLDAPTEASHSRKAQTKQRYVLSIPLVFKIKMCI